MLNEKLYNTAKSPIYLELLRIEEYPFHTHDELEIIYVLKGKLTIEVSVYNIQLTAGNLFVVNHDTMHYIKGMTCEDLVLIMHIDIDQFKEYYPNIDASIFICNSEQPADNHQAHQELKELFLQITSFYFKDDRDRARNLQSMCINFLLILVNNFQNWHLEKNIRPFASDISSTNIYKDRMFQIQRLRRIVTYIYMNYSKKITLEDLAELEHVSKYYVSHLISTGLGTGFQDFLNGVRAEMSLEYIYGTKMHFEEIAEKCGFSSVNFFRKSVKDKVGDTPSALRKKYDGKTINTAVPKIYKYKESEAEPILRTFFDVFDTDPSEDKKDVVHFVVDISTSPSKACFKFEPYIYLAENTDIWDHRIIKNLTELKHRLKIGKVSISWGLLLDYYNKAGSWDYIHRFFYDLSDLNIDPAIVYKTKTSLMDSLIQQTEIKSDIKIKFIQLSRDEIFYLYNDSISIIKAALDENNNPIHIDFASLLNEQGLKRPPIYAVDFLRRLEGNIVHRGKDHLFTCPDTDSDFKLIILNDSQNIKDFILNLRNINRATIGRVFRINPSSGDEAKMWENGNVKRALTDDLRWSIENVCAPKTEFYFMESTPEQDFFIPLKENEVAMVVLNA